MRISKDADGLLERKRTHSHPTTQSREQVIYIFFIIKKSSRALNYLFPFSRPFREKILVVQFSWAVKFHRRRPQNLSCHNGRVSDLLS